ncbi:MAG: hypothetical protein KIT09_02575 [Bryobacteraceae bacterium]|nr:hypothetical protein [Bryobacteraceae bacterium]
MSKPKVVRIRIAVALDAEGNWSAAGWSGASDRDAMETAVDAGADLAGMYRPCYVTVEIPFPKPTELVGQVEEEEE